MIVIICILLFPLLIGIVGGIFGVLGSVIGGLFGLIGGLVGAIVGAIGAVFGAVFGLFGWMFGDHHHWNWPFNFFNGDVLTAIILVLVIVLITRSKTPRGPARR